MLTRQHVHSTCTHNTACEFHLNIHHQFPYLIWAIYFQTKSMLSRIWSSFHLYKKLPILFGGWYAIVRGRKGNLISNLYNHTKWNFIFEMSSWDLWLKHRMFCHLGNLGQMPFFCHFFRRMADFCVTKGKRDRRKQSMNLDAEYRTFIVKFLF